MNISNWTSLNTPSIDENSKVLQQLQLLKYNQEIIKNKQDEVNHNSCLASIAALEEGIKINSLTQKFFSDLQQKIASDLNFRNSLDSTVVDVLMSLNLNS